MSIFRDLAAFVWVLRSAERWPSAIQPSWLVVLGFFSLITLMLILDWRRHQPKRTIDRLSILAWEASGIPTFSQSLPQLRIEMASARRYQRPLALAVLTLEGGTGTQTGRLNSPKGSNGNGNGATSMASAEVIQLIFPLLGSVLKEVLRGMDKVTYDGARNHYVLVFPQTRKAEARQAVRRLKQLLVKRSSLSVMAGLAEFPADGLILEDLVSAARAACDQQTLQEATLTSAVRARLHTIMPQ
jgi:hypothetical protein